MALPGQQKPASFLRSTWEGIKGYIKGGIAGAAIGAVIVGGIAAVVAAFAPDTALSLAKVFGSNADKITSAIGGPDAVAGGIGRMAGAGLAALSGGVLGAGVFSGLGSLAGAVTGVVRSREAAQPSAGALVNALNMAHQHGELVGQQQVVQQLMAAQQQQHLQQQQGQQHAHDTKWRDKVAKEQAATAVAQANATVH